MKRTVINKKRQIRKLRNRKKVGKGTKTRPRLSVFRSNSHIYAQIIDDSEGKTIVSASSFDVKGKKLTKTERAEKVGELIAKSAKDQDITKVVFDKGAYNYHGRVKALAEGARSGGLKF